MNFTRIIFFLFVVVFATASGKPWNIFKEIERAVARTRDAVISAGPAVRTVAAATSVASG
uniref:Antibacterial peptide enbocin n=1 Tax=Bombyx mori TaxID=7091 RepID=CECE_BOMMO|nr:antibacterial peptide enbocin precursor [Bombyx mori]P48821.1 RecName: Full=Antibacterial peptide enbocin; AltName: Full=Moricin; Flags: Precursor [Bombyx mori]AAC02238.1 enbocin [Bombyx mori]AAC05493.1 antibacterial peptide enbocin [Bombyx mori]